MVIKAVVGGSERPEGRLTGCIAAVSATAAMWPAVGHGGRPTKEAAGPLPAGAAIT